MQSANLDGKVAIVTGAAGELGSEIAARLLGAGASVAWVGRRRHALEQRIARADKDARSLALYADVRNEAEVRAAVAAARRRFGRIDFLINNAGSRGPTTPVVRLSRAAWQEVLDTNLTGPFLFSRECLKQMQRNGAGGIINIASVVGRWAYPLRAAYAASKAGLINLTLTLAQEAGSANVRVNAICPGPVDGRAVEGVFAARARTEGVSEEEMRARFVRPAALGRMVAAEDISAAVLFLCSESARNITGQVIDVSAGFGLWPGI